MSSKPYYYEESGKVGIMAIFTLLLTGIIGAGVLGVIYSYGTWYIPIIYANVILTAAYGFGMGMVTKFGGKLGKVRNTKILVLSGFLMGILAEYVQWVVWLYIYTPGMIILNPSDIFELMKQILPIGVWSIGRSQTTVFGAALAAVWIVEAIMIIVIPVVVCTFKEVFCEDCSRWIDDEKTAKFQITNDIQGLKLQFEDGNFQALEELEMYGENYEGPRMELEYCICKDCGQVGYINLEKVDVLLNGSETEEDREDIIENLIINRKNFDDISEKVLTI